MTPINNRVEQAVFSVHMEQYQGKISNAVKTAYYANGYDPIVRVWVYETYFRTIFDWARLITGATKKETSKLLHDLQVIRLHRTMRRAVCNTVPKFWVTDDLNDSERLYPLPLEKYQEFAEKMYLKRGCPTFGFRKISGVVVGKGTINENRKSFKERVIYDRKIGIKVVRIYNRYNKAASRIQLMFDVHE
jgi:hypothetical protein